MVRPCAAVVHRCLNRQARQAIPNTALRVLVMVFVTPAGQVRVPAAESWVKSSMVNPPPTAGLSSLLCKRSGVRFTGRG